MTLERFPPLTLNSGLGFLFFAAHYLLHTLVMVVNSNTEYLLRAILAHDILIKVLL